jgi:hypothetical protein
VRRITEYMKVMRAVWDAHQKREGVIDSFPLMSSLSSSRQTKEVAASFSNFGSLLHPDVDDEVLSRWLTIGRSIRFRRADRPSLNRNPLKARHL